jgi:[3-methyl-2-oxobutanoate dehydrogenase (acetyl-transferring)] kinase
VSYVAAHLDYALYELLKNAARAVVERHHHAAPGANGGDGRGGAPPARLPPVQVRICGGGGGGDVTIRISDQGGGIPPAHLSRVWEFGFTTLDQWEDPSTSTGEQRGEGLGLDDLAGPGGGGGGAAGGCGAAWAAAEGGAAGRGRWRMGGLGFGLPLSRLYARYFGGDLRLVSMPVSDGGPTAALSLPHLLAAYASSN